MESRPREVEDWRSLWSPDQQQQVQWLAGRVHAAAEGFDEAIEWRRHTFTINGNWHHWLCAIAVMTQGVDLIFHKGSLLDDPAGVLQGQVATCVGSLTIEPPPTPGRHGARASGNRAPTTCWTEEREGHVAAVALDH